MASLNDLELKHLVALDAVASAGTFGKAAQKLGYTQSAISQQIAALERLVGEQVFDRPGGPRPVELTPIGERLLAHSVDLLRRVDATVEDLTRFQAGEVGRLTIGSYQSVSSTVLPAVVATMFRERPELELRVTESDEDDDLYQQLNAGCLDVSFATTEAAGDAGFEVRHLLDDPYVLIARPGQFPIGPVAMADLNGIQLIGQPANSCQLVNEAGLRAAGVEPTYVFRTVDNGTLAAMVRSGMGAAVMPLLCVDSLDPRIVLHRLEPAIPPRQVALAWRADRPLPLAAQRFVEIAAEVSAELAAQQAETMAAL